jgi:hypothetical protein
MSAKFEFKGGYIEEQIVGGPDEGLSAILTVSVKFDDGQIFTGTARIKQTVGSDYREKIIEVGPIQGLPRERKYDYSEFAKAARQYYTTRVVKKGP